MSNYAHPSNTRNRGGFARALLPGEPGLIHGWA